MREATDRFGDALLAGLSAALFTVQILTGAQFEDERGGSLAVALAFSASLALRRRMPLVPLVAGLALIEASNLWLEGLADSGVFFVGNVLAVYAAGRHTDGAATVAAAILLLIEFPLAAIEPGQPFSASDAIFIAVALAGPFVGGRVIRRRHESETALRVRTIALEHERDVQARAGGRRGARPDRARVARRGRARHLRDGAPGRAAGAASCRRGAGRGARGARRDRAAPAARRWRTCAGCSGCCATTRRSAALAPPPA